MNQAHLPAKAETAPIDIFVTNKPERPYREVGLVRTDGQNPKNIIAFLEKGARQVGGDGVIVTGTAGAGGGWWLVGFLGGGGMDPVYEGVVIQYLDGSPVRSNQ